MDLSDLSLFMDVARLGSFAAAARERAVEPSSISRAVADLEARLGVRLFQRTTRRMALTEAGERLFARAPVLLDELERLRDDVAAARTEPSGTLRITASVAFGQVMLAPLLPGFHARFPGLQLELIFTDAHLDLVADRIDLAFRLGPGHRNDVQGVKLFETRYHVVASPDWMARNGPLAGPAALADHACLLFALPEFRSRWRLKTALGAEQEVAVHGAFVFSTALALKEAALLGLGPALLADWLIGSDLAAGRLVDLFPHHRAAAGSFDTAAWLLYPSAGYLPRKTRAALAHFSGAWIRPKGPSDA